MDIDENPFSYFLESPSLDDYDDSFDLGAGIEGSSTPPNPEIRSVSPSDFIGRRAEKVLLEEGRRLKRERTREREERLQSEEENRGLAGWLAVGAPLSLRDFTDRQSRKRRAGGPPSTSIQRGRGVMRLTPSPRGSGRVRSRSASIPRRHSWREPSPEIVSIPELDEVDDMMLDAREQTPDLLSDNGLSELEGMEEPEVVRKRPRFGGKKKSVRWAMPVRAEIDN